jgi:hypothetical protein
MRGSVLIEQYGSGMIDFFFDDITVSCRKDGRWSVFAYVDGFNEMGKRTVTERDRAVGLKTLDDVVAAVLGMLNDRGIPPQTIARDELLLNAAGIFGRRDALAFIASWDNSVRGSVSALRKQ